MKIISTTLALFMLGTSNLSPAATEAAKPATAAVAETTYMSDGEVRKVDKDTRKITLKHGELKNLDMPAMTMVFQVKEATLLDKVKTGDKVKFKAEKAGSGYAVTAIEVVK